MASEDKSPPAVQLESIEAKPAIQFPDNMEDIEDGSPIQLEAVKSNPVIKFSALKHQLEVQVVPDSEPSSPGGMEDNVFMATAPPLVIPSAPKHKLAPLPSVLESEPSSSLGDEENRHRTTLMVSRYDF